MVNIIASPFVMEDIVKLKQAKASSIVLGMPFFSVSSTCYFSNEQVQEALVICRAQQLQCYILMNRFFIEAEIDAMKQQLKFLKDIGVDGIYFSDIGVFQEARKLQMESKMIYNPDTILTNANDVRAYMDLGMKMCTLAKEITLEDMISIGNKCDCNLEVIIHGRLNMMHSKRNLLSNYMQFLNVDYAVKGKQQLYLMEENRDEHMPIVEDETGTHIYTGFTLCSFEEVEDILKANITNLRIESMFHTIEEVVKVIEDYVCVIENPQRGREYYQMYVKQYPNQNITKGFLYKKTGLVK